VANFFLTGGAIMQFVPAARLRSPASHPPLEARPLAARKGWVELVGACLTIGMFLVLALFG
jgi:hypothetical protein